MRRRRKKDCVAVKKRRARGSASFPKYDRIRARYFRGRKKIRNEDLIGKRVYSSTAPATVKTTVFAHCAFITLVTGMGRAETQKGVF